MNSYRKLLPILFAVLISLGASGIARAQYNDYAFVVFETTVTKKGVETSDANPEERRFYISNVVEFSEGNASVFRNAAKLADEYFIANVVKPMEAKGILHQYYDDAITINNKASYVETRPDVEDLRKKVLADLQEQNANVFTFTWTRDKNAKGLETSNPTLVKHNPEQPLYGAVETKTTAPVTPTTPKTPEKKPKRKN
jgi:hypothetical protein